jgi:hypothetical protein
VVTPELYNKIDLEYSSSRNGLKFYFVVKPGGLPSNIKMEYLGGSWFSLDGTTNALTINSSIGSLVFKRPRIYQVDNSNDTIHLSGWTPAWQTDGASNKYKFSLGAYDSAKVLIIQIDQDNQFDVLHHGSNHGLSTYFGGQGDDEGMAVAADSDGNAYYTGKTSSIDFPITAGPMQPTNSGMYDAYMARFDRPNYSSGYGDNQVWTTYFGAALNDYGLGVVTTGNGSTGKAVFTGVSESASYLMPPGNTGNYIQDNSQAGQNAFIFRVNSNVGSLDWLTFYGGDGDEIGNCIAKDNSGNIYIGGKTSTSAFSSTSCDVPGDNGFPYCVGTGNYLNDNGTDTYGGGATDGFIAKFDVSGTLLWSTFYGGSGDDEIKTMVVDPSNNLFLAGKTTGGTYFPFPSSLPGGSYNQTTYGGGGAGEYDGFVSKLSSTQVLNWSTFIGGDEDDEVEGIDLDITGTPNLFVTGRTATLTPACSTCTCAVPTTGQFPLCDPGSGAYYQAVHGNIGSSGYDGFMMKFSNAGAIQWSTFYGGQYDDEATGIVCDEVYVSGTGLVPTAIIVGQTYSDDLVVQQPWLTLGTAGSFYLYMGDGDQTVSVTAFSDHYLTMFSNTGKIFWGTNYADLYQSGHDKNNAITSTKNVPISDPSSKQIYITGYTSHYDYQVHNATGLINPYTQAPAGGMGTLSLTNRDAVISRFSYVSLATSINDNPSYSDPEVLLYPNPSAENIIVEGTLLSSGLTLSIYDIIGKLVYYKKLETKGEIRELINVSSLDAGVYVLELSSETEKASKKFIKH